MERDWEEMEEVRIEADLWEVWGDPYPPRRQPVEPPDGALHYSLEEFPRALEGWVEGYLELIAGLQLGDDTPALELSRPHVDVEEDVLTTEDEDGETVRVKGVVLTVFLRARKKESARSYLDMEARITARIYRPVPPEGVYGLALEVADRTFTRVKGRLERARRGTVAV